VKIDKSQVLTALEQVADPVTGSNLIAAGRLTDLQINDNKVQCTLNFTESLSGEAKSAVNFACQEAIKKIDEGLDVHVHLQTQVRAGDPPRSVLPQVKNIIAVASGKGGVGKSTISTNLALALKDAGASVGLMDADLYGPSIPTMLNLKGKRPQLQDVHGKPKIIPLEAYGLKVMSIGFIVEPEQAVVLRGPRLAGIIKQFIQECLWPPLDYLIIDLPPGTGDIQLTLVQTVPVTGALIVTTPQQVAVDDALKAMNMFRLPSINVPILGVIENMSWFTPSELPDHRYKLFGEGGGQRLADMGEVPLLGQIPLEMSVMEGGETGKPVLLQQDKKSAAKALSEMTARLRVQVKHRNETGDPTQIVQIKA
jgi:ATP-binding protein involved in chromosome partitioning